MTDKPADLLLERDVLGTCLLRPDAIRSLGLSEEDFSTAGNRAIWQALFDMSEVGERIDLLRLRSKLVAMGALELAGGEQTLDRLRYAGKPADLPIDKLKSLTRMRALRAAAEEVAKKCAEGELAEAQSALADAHAASMATVQRKRTQSALDMCGHAILEILSGADPVERIHPGFELMEECLGSIPVGCTVSVIASTNVGKSGFVLEMLWRAAKRNVKCGYISVEDQEAVVSSRLLSMASGVSSRTILHRRLDAEQLRAVSVADRSIPAREMLTVSILQGGTDADVCAAMSEQAAKGVKLMAVDYLQKIVSSKSYASKAHEVSAAATRITAHAQRLGVACVLVSQVSRDKTRLNECPSKHDMKESGDLENMVDAIVALWREKETDDALIWAKLVKVKWGGVGKTWCLKRTNASRLEEVPGSDKLEPPTDKSRQDVGKWSKT